MAILSSISRCVALPLIIATAAACSGGTGDDSATTSAAATSPSDIFDGFVAKFGSSFPNYTAVSHHADSQTLQYSAAYVPDEETDPHFSTNPTANPMVYSLVKMIEATPAGANIHMAHFQFDLPVVADALVDAINRGVGVKLVKSDDGENDDGQANAGISVTPRVCDAIKAYPGNDPNSCSSDITICHHKVGGPNDPGACIGEHLMHNKFVLFSKICKSGLDAKNACVGGDFYGGVSAQMSVNLEFHNLYNFNTLTVFGGDGIVEDPTSGPVAYTELYTNYRTYFDSMVSIYNSDKVNPPAKFSDLQSIKTPGNGSSFEGLPILPAGETNDQLIEGLKATSNKCLSGTTVYITSNLWSYDPSDSSRRDYKMMEAVKAVNSAGCKLVIAGASSMNVNSSSFQNDADNKESQLWAAAYEIKKMNLGPDQFRFFKDDKAPSYVTLHAKLIIVEQPTGNKQGYTNELMFGSLTMENDAVLNDQVWLRIGDPDATTFAFYKNVFNQVFSRLSGRASDIPDTDPSGG